MADSDSSQQQSVGGMADASGVPGNYSNSAITSLHAGQPLPADRDEQILVAKISRAMSSGPFHITRDATVADMDAQGNVGSTDVSMGPIHGARPGSGGQRPPRVSRAMAISASGL